MVDYDVVALHHSALGNVQLLLSESSTSLISTRTIKTQKVETEKIAAHAEGTFWYVLPSLPMFLVMPWMMKKGISFPASLAAGVALTGVLYLLMTKALAKFGMNL